MKRKLWSLLAALAILTCLPGAAQAANLQVHYIDVKQGDSAWIELPNDETMLIDAGKDNGMAATYLEEQGCDQLDYVIATHPDADHIGGMEDIIHSCEVEHFYMPDKSSNTKTYARMLDALEDGDVDCTYLAAGEKLVNTSKLKVQCYSPLPGISYGSDTNDYSAVIKITYGKTSFLFTGDAGLKTEDTMLQQYSAAALKSTVLKVSHHGSKTGTGSGFLQAVSPKHAVISVGKNSYGHPSATVLNRLDKAGVAYYRTDKNGTIIFDSTGSSVSTTAKKNNPTKKKTSVTLKTPSVTVKKASSTSIKVSWGKVSKATGYCVYRSTKSGSGYQKIKTTKSLSFTDKSVKKGNTYYYKVRAYRTSSGKKVYSGYSKVKNVKLSKAKSQTVYVTKTGECYHRISNCGRGTYYKSTLEEAKRQGLRPCKKCW